MQRRQHEVPGQARLHGDLRGLEVADLADHDDVGVLAQDRAQRAREIEPDPRVDLRLGDPVEVVLDRSSTVIMLRPPRSRRESAAYSVVVFPIRWVP
jgi:hypothetical protein